MSTTKREVLRAFLEERDAELGNYIVESRGGRGAIVRRKSDGALLAIHNGNLWGVRPQVFGLIGAYYSREWRTITPMDLQEEESETIKAARAVLLTLKADPDISLLYGYCCPVVDVEKTLASMATPPATDEEREAVLAIFEGRLAALKHRVGLNY